MVCCILYYVMYVWYIYIVLYYVMHVLCSSCVYWPSQPTALECEFYEGRDLSCFPWNPQHPAHTQKKASWIIKGQPRTACELLDPRSLVRPAGTPAILSMEYLALASVLLSGLPLFYFTSKSISSRPKPCGFSSSRRAPPLTRRPRPEARVSSSQLSQSPGLYVLPPEHPPPTCLPSPSLQPGHLHGPLISLQSFPVPHSPHSTPEGFPKEQTGLLLEILPWSLPQDKAPTPQACV